MNMALKSIILASFLTLSALTPLCAESPWAASFAAEQLDVNETKCFVSGQNVRNGAGQVLEVYNVTGVRVASFRIDGDDKTFALNMPKGIYILKVGKFVRKISLR